MRKIISVLLLVSLLLCFFTPIVSAQQKENTITYKIVWENGSLKLASVSVNLFNSEMKLSSKSTSIKIFISRTRHKDPTLGIVENLTEFWKLLFYINGEFAFELLPGKKVDVYLDVGSYSIMVEAYVQTFFGERLVGVFNSQDRINLEVDGRMLSGKYVDYGWRASLQETNFKKPY
jgi:hypothetical protein